MPTDAPPSLTPASKRIAESLHRKIQIVSRAVRLLEHKLRGEALLSLSNILSIIHKEEGKIKRCWLALKKKKIGKKKVLDCVADTAVTYGLMWVFLFFFYLPQLSEIYIPGGCIHCERHCTDMSKTNDRHGNASLSDWLPAGANYSAYLLLAQLLCDLNRRVQSDCLVVFFFVYYLSWWDLFVSFIFPLFSFSPCFVVVRAPGYTTGGKV